jgi:hypothetical protein
MPPRPQSRSGDISAEIMHKLDRAIVIRARIAKLKDELALVEKDLCWRLLPEAGFSEWWIGSMQSPADAALNHNLAQGSRQPGADHWSDFQADRRILLEALQDWKQRKHRANG